MNLKPEFPVPTKRECEAIRSYFDTESQFMASGNFFTTHRNCILRRHAVSTIARHTTGVDTDQFIPYLAMNYFDRYVSRNGLERVDGRDDIEKTQLIAICCLTISSKMRTKNFSLDKFLNERYVRITHPTIMRTELHILDALQWRMRSVTAFCFLNHYYPYFKKLGGFKRRCINEIIVQAQGDCVFAHYKPSQIALSAFLAASKIVYQSKFKEIDYPNELTECLNAMVRLCITKKIEIEVCEPGNASSSSEVVAAPQGQSEEITEARNRRRKGKAVVVVDSSEEDVDDETQLIPRRQDKGDGDRDRGKAVVVADATDQEDVAAEIDFGDMAKVEAAIKRALEEKMVRGTISEIVPISEAVPKKLMNFELKWPTDVPPIESEQPTDDSLTVTMQGAGGHEPAICGCCSIS